MYSVEENFNYKTIITTAKIDYQIAHNLKHHNKDISQIPFISSDLAIWSSELSRN